MNLSQWFDRQLQSTLEGFMWAIRQLPPERLYSAPPKQLGEWSAAHHVFHLLEYEERFALPSMYQWLGAPSTLPEEELANHKRDLPPIDEMLSQFEKIRRTEISLLPKFSEESWSLVKKTTFWGDVSLYWLVCKTYQHTVEHTHNILSLTLFWDRILKRTHQTH